MLKIHSIFESLNEEVGVPYFPQGTWCTIIRLQGCNLRCKYCDITYSQEFKEGKEMNIEEIITEVKNKYILITGGEPLFQKIEPLIEELSRQSHSIQVETNGSYNIPNYLPCGWIVNYKLESSGMTERMLPLLGFVKNLSYKHVIIKFVITTKKDFKQTTEIMEDMLRFGYNGKFAISPMKMDKTVSALLIPEMRNFSQHLKDRLIFSLNLQFALNQNNNLSIILTS